jgi:ABC-type cobalt transport system substrate-binding protein
LDWSQKLLDSVVSELNTVVGTAGSILDGTSKVEGLDENSIEAIRSIIKTIEPYFTPIVSEVEGVIQSVVVDPRVAAAIQVC